MPWYRTEIQLTTDQNASPASQMVSDLKDLLGRHMRAGGKRADLGLYAGRLKTGHPADPICYWLRTEASIAGLDVLRQHFRYAPSHEPVDIHPAPIEL
jgi:hypothetical protein